MPDAKLTADMIPVAEKALALRLLAEPATFQELTATADRACGKPDGDPCYRFTDQWLQKLRRKGFAKPMRDGRRTFWSYQPTGFDVLNRMASA